MFIKIRNIFFDTEQLACVQKTCYHTPYKPELHPAIKLIFNSGKEVEIAYLIYSDSDEEEQWNERERDFERIVEACV